ncbi:hypothetical protein [Haloglomus litoreum]|uniref:hypothetical protein n=1 Tax=Haloglomus litoreum TaxID=3034026 RepID=UPI0023E8DDD0|nr:hypothetical protein [Haloglomus sp. DT116]
MAVSYRYLFDRMVREEWRLHSELFGSRRFAMFPFFVAFVAAGTATFFALGNAAADTLLGGLHLVVALLGLQVGTVGLVGRDALEDLLGDTTLLLYAARTLPVSFRRLMIAFVFKDVLYYAVLFILPLAVGVAPLAYFGLVPWTTVPLVFVTAGGMFTLGVALSLFLVGVYTRSRLASLAVTGVLVAALVLRGGAVVSVTPYQLVSRVTPAAVAGSVVLPVALTAVGIALFEFDRRTPARTARDRFRFLHSRLGGLDRQGALTKSLLDVGRSSGGLWKVVFSQGLVFGVLAVLLAYLPEVVPVRPAPGLTIATILALGTFTTYNWLCQFEDGRFYLRYPVTLTTVFRAKLIGFAILALPVGLGYLALGGVVFGYDTAVVGLLVFPPLALYVFGVTAYVAGLEPTELLFDTPTFALFTLAMMAVLLPLVIIAIAFDLYPPLQAGGAAVGIGLVAGGIGAALYTRAGRRWERKALAGTG